MSGFKQLRFWCRPVCLYRAALLGHTVQSRKDHDVGVFLGACDFLGHAQAGVKRLDSFFAAGFPCTALWNIDRDQNR